MTGFQIMLPYNYAEFSNVLTSLVKKKVIPMSRIDDAVSRILRVKFIAGLFESPMSDESFISYLGSKVMRPSYLKQTVNSGLLFFGFR